MSVSIVNVLVGDDYTDGAAIIDVAAGSGGSYDVEGANVIYQLQEGPPGQFQWGPESFAKPGGGTISAGATGIRFKNAVAGAVATVSAYIAGPGQPVLQVMSTNSAAGGVTPFPIDVAGAGVFTIPAGAQLLRVVCVGAGGGGAGGLRSNAANTQAGGGAGGGGGGVSIADLDVGRLLALYPNGVPYNVGAGGQGGIGGVAAAVTAGAKGGDTTFGFQQAGGGGGGQKPGSLGGTGGGGGGVTGANAATGLHGSPTNTATATAPGSGIEATAPAVGISPTEYGGSAGGSSNAGSGFPTLDQGNSGGNSMLGGCGGGAGAGFVQNAPAVLGLVGGSPGDYANAVASRAATADGTFDGIWTGGGGGGGQSATNALAAGSGGNGSVGSGGGGGGGSALLAPGNGGNGGDGQIVVYVMA